MKNLLVTFCNILTVALVFCVIEIYDEVSVIDGILLGMAATLGVIGSITAAVVIKSIGE
jgi:hypothetical protein